MIKSMTGFQSLTRDEAEASVGVTIRAVNHRYLDLQLRLPAAWVYLEPRLRALLQERLSRGRVELSLSVQVRHVPSVEVEINEDVTRALAEAIGRLRENGLVTGGLAAGDLLRVPQAMAIRERQVDPESPAFAQVAAVIEAAVSDAAAGLDAMRTGEGASLRADLDRRTGLVARLMDTLAAAAEEGRASLDARLRQRISELPLDLQGEQAAVAQEIVRFTARSDISEELVRFRAHLTQWAALTESPEPCGRKLDFVLQEMNREVNTVGAKADGPKVSELIVEIKAELERMREQVQNVE
ncbi:MAG: YicC family protein [Acidobacteria bacterium]|nr:MAG: YicC family protein [Acidobacteriota bacterium]RPJ85549.1 MAG: YicC family protein [Acidobacteriota bacterium]